MEKNNNNAVKATKATAKEQATKIAKLADNAAKKIMNGEVTLAQAVNVANNFNNKLNAAVSEKACKTIINAWNAAVKSVTAAVENATAKAQEQAKAERDAADEELAKVQEQAEQVRLMNTAAVEKAHSTKAKAVADRLAKISELKAQLAKEQAQLNAEQEQATAAAVDVAKAHQLKGTATLNDTAVMNVTAANDNAAAYVEKAANLFNDLRKDKSFKAAFKDFNNEGKGLFHAVKDMKARWEKVGPVLNAANVGVTLEQVNINLFFTENINPFLQVATAEGVKVATLGRNGVKAVKTWNAEKCVLVLIVNRILNDIVAKDATAKAAADKQVTLLINAAKALQAAVNDEGKAKAATKKAKAATKKADNAATLAEQEQAKANADNANLKADIAKEKAAESKAAADTAKATAEQAQADTLKATTKAAKDIVKATA